MYMQTVQPAATSKSPPEGCCHTSKHAKIATILHWIISVIAMLFCFICIFYYVLALTLFAIIALVCFIFAMKGKSYLLLIAYMVYCVLYEILFAISLAVAISESSGNVRGFSILSAASVFAEATSYLNDPDAQNTLGQATEVEKTVAKVGIVIISLMLVFTIYDFVIICIYYRYLKRKQMRAPITFITTSPQVLQPYAQNPFYGQNPPYGQNQALEQNGPYAQNQYYAQPYGPNPATSYPPNAAPTTAYPLNQELPGVYVAPSQPGFMQPAPQNQSAMPAAEAESPSTSLGPEDGEEIANVLMAKQASAFDAYRT